MLTIVILEGCNVVDLGKAECCYVDANEPFVVVLMWLADGDIS